MKARFVASAALVILLGSAGATARPFPPQLDWCATQFHRGPVSTSCPLVYGGGRVTVFGAAVATEAPARITIDIVIGQGIDERVLFSCTSAADGIGTVALPTSECLKRSSFLPIDVGTEVRCLHRGPGEGAFGCLTT